MSTPKGTQQQPTTATAPPPTVSKANASDNWRQPAAQSSQAAATGAGGGAGWTVAEKKERKAAAPRERKEKGEKSDKSEKSSKPSTSLQVPPSSSWAAASANDALPSPTFSPVVLPSEPPSTLPTLESLPSSTASPAVTEPTKAALSAPSEPKPTPVLPPSLPPKVNPWAGVKKAPVSVPIVPVVAGATDWPSPQEEKPAPILSGKKDHHRKRGQSVSDEAAAAKKKGEKTTWVPIKADITVSSAPSGRLPNSGEKRTKAPRRDGAAPGAVPGAAGKSANEKAGQATRSQPGGSSAAAVQPNSKKEHSAPRPAQSSSKSASTPSSASTTSKAHPSNGAPLKSPPAGRADFALPKKPIVPSAVPTSSVHVNKASLTPRQPTATPPSNATAVLRPFSGRPISTPDESTPQPASVPFISKPQRAAAEFDAAFTPAPPNGFPRSNHPNVGRGGAAGGRGYRGRGGMVGNPRGPFAPQIGAGGRPHVNGFVPQVEQAQAAAAYAYVPVMMTPEEETKYWLLGQIEYYFSIDNLCRDMFLRSKMDSEGWLEIALIGSFNRIKNLSQDPALILSTMLYTPLLEVSASQSHVRLAAGWAHWVLPNAVPSVIASSAEKEEEDGHESTSEDDEGTESRAATTVSSGSQADESSTTIVAPESAKETREVDSPAVTESEEAAPAKEEAKATEVEVSA
ncbi:la-related protein 1, partial [Phenoliferia sp. Uapishka_3]